MSVFLRWGVFGILGVAGLLYAYNASKRLAETRAVLPPPPAVSAPLTATPATDTPRAAPVTEPAVAPLSPACEEELLVARRALDMRGQGDPLDRVLRIQEIAWQQDATRRARLAAVATRWHGYEGDFSDAALRAIVTADCAPVTPAP
jgi:hypothetical protein